MTDAARGRLETALILLFGAWFLIPRAIQTLKTAKGVHTAVGAEASYTGLASAAQRGLFYLTIGFCLWIIALLWRRSPSRRGRGALSRSPVALRWPRSRTPRAPSSGPT